MREMPFVSVLTNAIKENFYEFFSYSTVRSATIKSIKVGIVYRFAQFIILVYIIGYELMYSKGYQTFDTVSSAVTTKVKGQGFVPINKTKPTSEQIKSDSNFYKNVFTVDNTIQYKILDTSDYVVPPNEYNSVFIMTHFIETYQKQGTCPEEVSKYKATCKSDSDCQNVGTSFNTWNGIPTGKCVNSSYSHEPTVCEIYAWCPTDKYCPVFKLEYILTKIEPDAKERYQLLMKGGVILIEIIWNCDLDFGRICLPVYKFRRFDTKESNAATGFNFRFANKFKMDDVEYRTLYKAYGLRFIINVSGTAGRFYIVPLLMTIGAGIGIMSVSVIVTDCVMLNCTKKKKLYLKMIQLDETGIKDKILDGAGEDGPELANLTKDENNDNFKQELRSIARI